MKRIVAALALAALAVLTVRAPARAQNATIVMTADRTNVAVGEPFQLEIRADVSGSGIEEVELPDLGAFQILARRVARPMQFRFGFGSQNQVIQATTVHSFTLTPLRQGRIDIEPARVRVGGRTFTSNPITIIAGAGTAPLQQQQQQIDPNIPPGTSPGAGLDGAQVDPQAFVRTVVDKAQPYVGEQVTVTIYLYVRGGIRSAPMITREPTADGFWVHDLLPPQRALEGTRQIVNGTPYNVYVLRRFAAFPLRAGEVTIGPLGLDVEAGDLFDLFGPRRGPVHREGVPVSVRTRPLPPPAPRNAVVGRWQLTAEADRRQVPTGDAISLRVTARGEGNVHDVRLALAPIDGLRILEPQTEDRIEAPGDLVGGTRTITWLIVPERAGTYRIPAFELPVLDPRTGQYSTLRTDPIELTAAGSSIATPTPDPAATGDDEQPSDDGAGEVRFGPIRTTSELARASRPLSAEPYFAWLLAVPPFAWLALLLGRAARRRAAAQNGKGGKRAVRTARKRLAEAERLAQAGDARAFYGEVARALKAVLEARLGEPIGGLTHDGLRNRLIIRGMEDDLARRVVDELEGTDYARFSAEGSSADEMQRCIERNQALLERLDRFDPGEPRRAAS